MGETVQNALTMYTRPEVIRVFYPGLDDHPGSRVHRTQASSAGAVITAEFESKEKAEMLLNNVKLWKLAVSLGAVESLMTSPVRMIHATFPKETLEKVGITD